MYLRRSLSTVQVIGIASSCSALDMGSSRPSFVAILLSSWKALSRSSLWSRDGWMEWFRAKARKELNMSTLEAIASTCSCSETTVSLASVTELCL